MKIVEKLLVVLTLFSIVSCSIPEADVNENGSISFSITPFAPWVVLRKETTDSGKSPTGKAWMVANTVKAEFYQSSTIVKTETWTVNSSFTSSAQNITRTISSIPTGSYTKVVVSIFNNAVSTSSAVVKGESSTFTVTANSTTPITVTCMPQSIVDLTDNTWSSTYTIPTSGEKWFRANTPYGTTNFYVNSITGDMDVYVFKPDGTYLGQHTGTDATNIVTLTTPSNPYYICMFGYSSGSGRVGFASTAQNGSVGLTVR